MSWISGRTVSPTSNELVFWIDGNTNLPGSQDWEQMWQVCKGVEPIVGAKELQLIKPTLFSDDTVRATVRQGCCGAGRSLAGEHLTIELRDLATERMAPEEAEPMSNCSTSFRTLTFTLVNFDVTDGGDAIASTKGCIDNNCDEISIHLRTRGRNPSADVLSPMFPSDIERAIAWRESRWNHFLPSGKPKSNLNSNGTTDWGLMQVNEATVEQQWNWKLNLSQGISILAQKKADAQRYLNSHPHGVTQGMIENEMIQRYNGGRYYSWNAGAGRWVAQPANGYVASIRGFMATKPWSH